MDAKTLKALRGSILKWQGIIAGTARDEGDENCPLCKLFFNKSCSGCPVAERTGKICCDGSPYRNEWAPAVGLGARADTPEKIAAAKSELKFLESLLPERLTSTQRD